jgi:hypothetical protein
MKFLRLTLIFTFLLGVTASQAQLLDFVKNKKKNKKQSAQTEQPAPELEKTLPEKTFTYRCYTLNRNVERETIDSCLQLFARKIITDMPYYEQGEDVRYQEKNNSYVTLSFLDDTPKLVAVTIEDIEDVTTIQQLQQMILAQMGEPTQGYEMMKNYDGASNSTWTDYSTYEFVYRYVFGSQVYEFYITQFGMKMKDKKVIRPYSFSAVLSKKSEVAYNAMLSGGSAEEKQSSDKKQKESFYPAEGVVPYDGFIVEAKLLRKW